MRAEPTGAVEAPARASTTYVRDPAEVLVDVAEAAAAASDIPPLLDRLGHLTLEATGADRVSFLLLDRTRSSLELWATVTTLTPDEGLWELGRSLPGIPVDDARRAVLEAGEPVPILDASRSPLVPPAWSEAFNLASLVAAPLVCGSKPYGLLVTDYRTRRELPPELVQLVGAVARSAALAVGNAGLVEELAQRVDGIDALVGAAHALVSPRSLVEVAGLVADAIGRVMQTEDLSVHLLDGPGRFQTLVQRGAAASVAGDGRFADLPRRAVVQVRRAWRAGPPTPVALDPANGTAAGLLPDDARLSAVLALPLVRAGSEVFGFVLVGCAEQHPPSAVTLELAGALAAHVAVAVDRAQLDEQVAVAAEIARAVLALDDLGPGGADGLLAALHRAVPDAIGFEVDELLLRGRVRARSKFERRLWNQWRPRRTCPEVEEHAGEAWAPIWGGGRVLGMLRARPRRSRLARRERGLLATIGCALGEVEARRAMREQVERREREVALAEERTEVASQLHASVGKLLASIAVAADELAGPVDQAAVARRARQVGGLARTALGSLQEGVHDMAALAFDPLGLEATLADVVARLGTDLDCAADVTVEGEERPLPLEVELALVRVVHEAMARLGRPGRASAIAVRLAFRADEVMLEIRDDGVTLAERENGAGPAAHFGLRLMTRRIEGLGGSLEVEQVPPRGIRVAAAVPA